MPLLLSVLFLLTATLGSAYYIYRYIFFSPGKGRDRIPEHKSHQFDPYRQELNRLSRKLADRPYETITVFSHDGLTLSGRYYHVRDGAPLDIGFHGYRSHPLADFYGIADMSQQMGHNLLLVCQRAQVDSQGHTITFGIQERQDVLSWVYDAVERFGSDTPIFLYGVSMGAATVLMASELALPPNVKGIIADCPYASPLQIILEVARKRRAMPVWLVRPLAILGAKIYGGFSLREANAAQAVQNTKLPILILHGEEDHFVPCQMSDLVSRNPACVTRDTFPGAGHAMCYLADTPRYQKIVTEFIQKLS